MSHSFIDYETRVQVSNCISLVHICTCVFLRPHWPVDDPLEGGDPIALLGLRLAGEQELPVGRYYGDAVGPVVALGGGGQPGEDRVAVLLTANEHLPPGVRVLEGTQPGSDLRRDPPEESPP